MQKPPSPPLPFLQSFQKSVLDVASKASELAGEAVEKVAEHAEAFDKKHGVTDMFAGAGKQFGDAAKQLDSRYDVTGLVTKAYDVTAEAVGDVASSDQEEGRRTWNHSSPDGRNFPACQEGGGFHRLQ